LSGLPGRRGFFFFFFTIDTNDNRKLTGWVDSRYPISP